jgi:hypothetical protein
MGDDAHTQLQSTGVFMLTTTRHRTRLLPGVVLGALLLHATAVRAAADKPAAADMPAPAPAEHFKVEEQASEGSVTIAGHRLDYQAHAGTLIMHAQGWDDVPQNADKEEKLPPAEASMFYAAYFATSTCRRMISRRQTCSRTSNTGSMSPDTWSTPMSHRSRRCTTASRISSGGRQVPELLPRRLPKPPASGTGMF